MASRSDLRAALLNRLGGSTRTDATTANLDRWLNDGLLDLATQRVHLRSLEASATPIASQTGVPGYSLPTGAFSLLYLEDTVNLKVLNRLPGTFEEYLIGRQTENATSSDIPYGFIEYGNKFYITKTPQVNTISWTPYVYNYPTFGTGANDVPSIESEWHYAIEMFGAIHAYRELGDEERAVATETQWANWFRGRDTRNRMIDRFTSPRMGGVRPHPNWNNPRTGV